MSWFSGSKEAQFGLSAAPSPEEARRLQLYYSEYCGYCHRVERAISKFPELNIERLDVNQGHRKALFELTGRTQVPCLVIDGQPLLESRDIIQWLTRYAERSQA